jgi:signal transduction histidine kinase
MSGVEDSQKRAVTADRLRVPTQHDREAAHPARDGVGRRAVAAARRRARASMLPLCCLLFVVSAAVALVAAPGAASTGSGVAVDEHERVVSVDPSSIAWAYGVRPGWQRSAMQPGVTLYNLGTDFRPVPDDQQSSQPAPILALVPSLLALPLAGLLSVARQRRAGSTVAIGAAVLSSVVWSTRLGVVGEAIAILPVAVAALFAWQTADGLGMNPRLPRPISMRTAAAPAALVVVSGAVFAMAALAGGLMAGVAAAAIVYVGGAWFIVLRWRVRVASAGPEPRTRPAVARTVAFEMLPFSDRVRRRGAEAERDRLASDLHAEVLPAIASTAAALEQRGATHEAERLRRLAASVRDLVSARRLPMLEDRGLLAAAEWLAESLQERASLTIEIDLRGYTGARQPQRVERAAYRVLQLALDNVIRHSQAANASVAIAGDSRSLELVVADDGRGIDRSDAARAMSAGRLGLADMRNEAESVGASLEIAPRSPRGTVVSMRWHG